MSHLQQVLCKFLSAHHDGSSPLVLGLSGGPDSTALLYLLKKKVNLEVVHVDHGWRLESAQEAEQLRALCKKHNLPFHLKTLIPSELKGNKEDACRSERRAFFEEVRLATGAQATLLGHHADDQAETVLKRILEGAPLIKQSAIRPLRGFLWRPLLAIPKKKIVQWLEKQKIPYFMDPTNSDPAILRSRMRMEILPKLFGKEVAAPLARHAEEAALLSDYLDKRIAPLEKQFQQTGSVDLSKTHSVEIHHLLRKLHPFSKQQLAALTDALLSLAPSHIQGPFRAHIGRLDRAL